MTVDTDQFGDRSGQYWLTQGMARTVGVNLVAELAKGTITRADLDEMIETCAGCESTERCILYMAQGGDCGNGPPGYCLNHERIEALLTPKPVVAG